MWNYRLQSRNLSVSSSNCLLCLLESLIFSNFWNPFLHQHHHNYSISFLFYVLKKFVYIRKKRKTRARRDWSELEHEKWEEGWKSYDKARKMSAICPSISASSSLIVDNESISYPIYINSKKLKCPCHWESTFLESKQRHPCHWEGYGIGYVFRRPNNERLLNVHTSTTLSLQSQHLIYIN